MLVKWRLLFNIKPFVLFYYSDKFKKIDILDKLIKMFKFNFSGKIKEAEERVRQGEKYLKTSFLKWKPELDSAIDEFDKACTCYRVAEKYEECRDLSLRLGELQIQKGNFLFY